MGKGKNKFICFIGIDGSGKSTQAQNIVKYFENYNEKVKYVWLGWSPTLLKPFLKFIKKKILIKKGITEEQYTSYTELKKHVFKNKLKQNVWFCYITLDYFFQVLINIMIPITFLKKSIVCDRYIYDLVIDLSINFNITASLLFKNFPQYLFPTPDMIFFIDVKEEIAFDRKDDIPTIQYLMDRRKRYREIFEILKKNSINIKIIDGQIEEEVIKEQIISEIKKLN